MKIISALTLVLILAPAALRAAEQYVVEDGGVGLSREEVEYLVAIWTPDMREAAIKDAGDRIELLNMALASKKLAALVDKTPPEDDPQAYWKLMFAIRAMQSNYVVSRFMDSIEVPDMSELAAERYKTDRDKYALVPEQRLSSHILLLCEPGACDRDARRIEAQKILEKLQSGADFRELAIKYSEDPGSKGKGGQFEQWLSLGQAHVDPYFTGAVFDVDEVGEYSGIVDTKFGLHIIRLDDLRPAHYKPYEEVKPQIIAALRKEYVQLAAKKFDAGFRFTDEAYFDRAALDEILAPYADSAE